MAGASKTLARTLEQVLKGDLKQINYKSQNRINDSPGGALTKSVPRPKDTNVEADK